MLAGAGMAAVVDPPDVDERAADPLLAQVGPEGLALELARRKAAAVAPRHRGARVIAADQVGLLGEGPDAVMLTKQPTAEGAVDQLVAMSAGTHRLVNGLVVLDVDSGRRVEGVDVQVVTMRAFTRAEAEAYVARFEPFDSAGSYRLEDQEAMGEGAGFVVQVHGEHDSGVLGLPLPLLRRLLARITSDAGPSDR